MVKAIDGHELEQLLGQDGIFFVDFWASWCAPCRQFSPIYERVSTQYPQITFTSIDIEKETELAEVFQIRSIPHLMVFKSGIAIYSESGAVPESVLHELAKQAIDVDVSEVLKKMNDVE